MHTRQEFLKFCDLEHKTAKFTIDVAFQDLYNMGGVGGLNDQLESEVEDGHMLLDLSYVAIELPEKDLIRIEVFVADITVWLDEENQPIPQQLPIVGRSDQLARGTDGRDFSWEDSPTYDDEVESGLHQ